MKKLENTNLMKKYIKVLKRMMGVLLTVTFLVGCTDLDEELFSEVTDDNFFQTEEELIAALGSAYTSLYGYMGNTSVFGAQEVSSDEVVVPTRGPDWGDGGHWVRLHQHLWTPEDPATNSAWNFCFGGVNACNRLVFQFTELQNPLTDPFIGELKALRAIYYLWLLDIYGNVPIVTDFANADPTPFNNTRQEVYDFVESELVAALSDVTDDVGPSTYGRVNTMVVQTALAKLYLNAEVYIGTPQWANAVTACDAVINSGNYTIENDYFANFNTDNSGSSEFIMAIPYDEVYAGGLNLHMMSLSYINQQTYNLTAQPWNGFATLEAFYDSYEDIDLRKGQPSTEQGPTTVRGNFIVGPQWDVSGKIRLEDAGAEPTDLDGPPFTYRAHINEIYPVAWREGGARFGKYEFEIGSSPELNNDVPIYRYSDVLLMKAEALWRQNSADAVALGLVNDIRDRANVGPLAALTADNLLAERGREMFLECVRRSDQIRFGVFGDPWWEKAASDENKELFPLPGATVDANPNLTQNPGY